MKDEEIEFWYDEEKEKLQEEYLSKLKKGRNKEQAKKAYLQRMASIRRKYESLHHGNLRHESMKMRISHFITMILFPLRRRLALFLERLPVRKKKEEAL